MRTMLIVVLCAVASLAHAADREIPYKEMHSPFSRAAGIPNGKYFRLDTRLASSDPSVATADIKLVIKSRSGDIPVPVAADGAVQFPVREDLLKENPPVVTNVPAGKMQLTISMRVEAPPAQRFRYELMAAMQDDAKAIISKQGLMVRMMAPDFEGFVIGFAPGTAATATVELAGKPVSIEADAQGVIRIPDKKAWRKENPWIQLSAMPTHLQLEMD